MRRTSVTVKGKDHSKRNLLGLLAVGAIAVCVFLSYRDRWQRLRSQVQASLHLATEAGGASSASVSRSGELLSLCERSDSAQAHVELWGEVVVPGLTAPSSKGRKGLTAASAQDCCKSCASTRGCNTWVWCHQPTACQQQCWLKRVGAAADTVAHAKDEQVVWTSGSLPKDYDIDPSSLPPLNTSISTLVLHTAYGDVSVQLKPEWSDTSVAFVRRLAQQPELCSTACEFYRAEQGFLLQGSLRAYIPPNKVTREGPKIMERGEIGWAGGAAGPDFFIYLGAEPATHFGRSHTVWGKVADEASLQVVEKMVHEPATADKPGAMHMLDAPIPFTTGHA
ncbi:hypothetical protein V8C86DRAFT_2933089 [Haematococcus lacustris]